MHNSKELIKKTLTEQFLNYQLPSDTKDNRVNNRIYSIKIKIKKTAFMD